MLQLWLHYNAQITNRKIVIPKKYTLANASLWIDKWCPEGQRWDALSLSVNLSFVWFCVWNGRMDGGRWSFCWVLAWRSLSVNYGWYSAGWLVRELPSCMANLTYRGTNCSSFIEWNWKRCSYKLVLKLPITLMLYICKALPYVVRVRPFWPVVEKFPFLSCSLYATQS